MTEASASYHEPIEMLSDETLDMHRAIVSLIEELEAIDWYQQRADACNDDALRAILIHNKNEEIEHAMMSLEWIRRHLPKVDEHARRYLFSEGPIHELEHEAEADDSERSGDLGIRDLDRDSREG